MLPEVPTSFRRLAVQLLPIVCLLLIPCFGLAQSAGNRCEPAPAVKEDLKKVTQLNDEDLPYKIRRERQIATLQELLKKYPGDFYVERRYQDARLSGLFVDRDPVVAEYRERMQKNAKDPTAVYLYARVLIGQQTKEAIGLLQKLVEESPDFPWTHIKLAEIYNYPNFRDPVKLKEQLKQWTVKCPEALDALAQISRSGDKELMMSAAQSLRPRLQSSTSIDDLAYWEELWKLEFKLKPVPEHAQLRQQIAEDLKRIRALPSSKEQLFALQAGYKQIGDKTGQRWAEDELVRLLPKTDTARRIVQSRYYDEHPYQKAEESEAQKLAYNQGLVQVTGEWLKQWPDDEGSWSTRVRSLIQLEASSNSDVEAAYNGYARAHEKVGASYSIPPIEITVAQFYLKRGFRLESVPTLLQKGIGEIEQLEKGNRGSDLYSRPAGADESNLTYVRLEAWPVMAEVYARLKQPDKARDVLAQLADLIKPEQPAGELTDAKRRSFDYNQAVYWQAVGKVAEVEQRKLDALTAYQTALTFRPKFSETGKDELNDNTRRLWKELGGTEQGWQAYMARNAAAKSKVGAAENASWDSKNTLLPQFDLTDLDGRKWSLDDLKGKVAFINLWATWCGPCRAELPYVQKLRDQLKDRKDVLVLTLNIDEEVGMVQPFMKENKYTFPVILGHEYADGQGVNSIPRNWVVSFDGKVMFEGIGFGNDGEEWMKRARQIIEKVKGPN